MYTSLIYLITECGIAFIRSDHKRRALSNVLNVTIVIKVQSCWLYFGQLSMLVVICCGGSVVIEWVAAAASTAVCMCL